MNTKYQISSIMYTQTDMMLVVVVPLYLRSSHQPTMKTFSHFYLTKTCVWLSHSLKLYDVRHYPIHSQTLNIDSQSTYH